MKDIIQTGKEVIHLEALALARLTQLIDVPFAKAVSLIGACRGKVVVSGMGKAGLIGTKIAATFSSLGTASFFMHPADASHGDLGMVSGLDVLLLLSNSGESGEITSLLPSLKAIGVSIIAITRNPQSTLGKNAEVVLELGTFDEACLMGLAPTTSTTLMLALGDALAVAVMKNNPGFDERRYAFFHPGGSLGKKLLKVEQVMRQGEEVAICDQQTEIKSVLFAITHARSGLALIVDRKKKLVGVFTDGDLRRALEKTKEVLKQKVGEVMTIHPKTIGAEEFAIKAVKVLGENKIGDLPVVDDSNRPLGVVSAKDLLSLGLI